MSNLGERKWKILLPGSTATMTVVTGAEINNLTGNHVRFRLKISNEGQFYGGLEFSMVGSWEIQEFLGAMRQIANDLKIRENVLEINSRYTPSEPTPF